MTNREWLSSLSTDELTQVLCEKVKGILYCKDCLFNHSNEHHCNWCIEEWLELEHEENNND